MIASTNSYFIRDAEASRKRKPSSMVLSSLRSATNAVRKPFRDISFWGKAVSIYGSYKLSQARARVTRLRKMLTRKNKGDVGPTVQEIIDESWGTVHEMNSKRMVNLCLALRGFYLKVSLRNISESQCKFNLARNLQASWLYLFKDGSVFGYPPRLHAATVYYETVETSR